MLYVPAIHFELKTARQLSLKPVLQGYYAPPSIIMHAQLLSANKFLQLFLTDPCIPSDRTYHNICTELNEAKIVMLPKAVKDGVHGLLELLKLAAPHGTTCI